MKSNFIKEVNIINQKKNKITDFIGYEREAAIHDLISENFLRVKKNKFFFIILPLTFYIHNSTQNQYLKQDQKLISILSLFYIFLRV